jgi:hypothetical protein
LKELENWLIVQAVLQAMLVELKQLIFQLNCVLWENTVLKEKPILNPVLLELSAQMKASIKQLIVCLAYLVKLVLLQVCLTLILTVRLAITASKVLVQRLLQNQIAEDHVNLGATVHLVQLELFLALQVNIMMLLLQQVVQLARPVLLRSSVWVTLITQFKTVKLDFTVLEGL